MPRLGAYEYLFCYGCVRCKDWWTEYGWRFDVWFIWSPPLPRWDSLRQ